MATSTSAAVLLSVLALSCKPGDSSERDVPAPSATSPRGLRSAAELPLDPSATPAPTKPLGPARTSSCLRGSWSTKQLPDTVRRGARPFALRDGRVLLFGGEAGFSWEKGASSLFDPKTGRLTRAGLSDAPTSDRAALLELPDGRILRAEPGQMALYLDAARAGWSRLPPSTRTRGAAFSMEREGRILVADVVEAEARGRVRVVDPKTLHFTEVALEFPLGERPRRALPLASGGFVFVDDATVDAVPRASATGSDELRGDGTRRVAIVRGEPLAVRWLRLDTSGSVAVPGRDDEILFLARPETSSPGVEGAALAPLRQLRLDAVAADVTRVGEAFTGRLVPPMDDTFFTLPDGTLITIPRGAGTASCWDESSHELVAAPSWTLPGARPALLSDGRVAVLVDAKDSIGTILGVTLRLFTPSGWEQKATK